MDALKLYVTVVTGFLKGRSDAGAVETEWSEEARALLEHESFLLDIASPRTAVNPSYTGVPSEATLEAVKEADPDLYVMIVGGDSTTGNEQNRDWMAQVPKHCVCLWVDLLSIFIGIDQKASAKLLAEVTRAKDLVHVLRASVAGMLGFLLTGEQDQPALLPMRVFDECVKAWFVQSHYKLLAIREILELAADTVWEEETGGMSHRFIRELRTLMIRWARKDLLKTVCLEIMTVMEQLREHQKLRDSVQSRIATYETNLSRIGAALKGQTSSNMMPGKTFPFGSTAAFSQKITEASLKRLWELLSILLSMVSSVYLTNVNDFHQLFALCPNLISFKALESKIGIREPERGISATEYDLFVEQNLFENDQTVSLFDVTPILCHAIAAVLQTHPHRLILPEQIPEQPLDNMALTPKSRQSPLPFSTTEQLSTAALLNKCISVEHGLGRLVLWLCVGVPNSSEETFKMGLARWDCLDYLREIVLSRFEPNQPVDKAVLRILFSLLAPFYSDSLNPTHSLLQFEIQALNEPVSEATGEREGWTGDLTARRSRLDAPRQTLRTTRRPSPRGSEVKAVQGCLASLLILCDSIVRRMPTIADKFIPLLEAVGISFPFDDAEEAESKSTRSELPGAWEIVPHPSTDEAQIKRQLVSIAYEHFGATLMMFGSDPTSVASQVFQARGSVFAEMFATAPTLKTTVLTDLGNLDVPKLLWQEGKVKPLYQLSHWDSYLRCLAVAGQPPQNAPAEWLTQDEAICVALNVCMMDSASLTQKAGMNAALAESRNNSSGADVSESLEWVNALISLKIAALTVLSAETDSSLAEALLRQLMVRTSFFRLDCWLMDQVTNSLSSTHELRNLRSTYLTTLLKAITTLLKHTTALPALRETLMTRPTSFIPQMMMYDPNSSRNALMGWQHLLQYIEAEILPWLNCPKDFGPSCWRMVAVLADLVTMILSQDSLGAARMYLASNLLSDSSLWFAVMMTSARRACQILTATNPDAESRIVESALGSLIGVMYQLIFRQIRSDEEETRSQCTRWAVVPGIRPFATLICRSESAFVWNCKETAPNMQESEKVETEEESLFVLLAKYMTLNAHSAVVRKELLPIFCRVAITCGPQVARQLNEALIEELQMLFSYWLGSESVQVEDDPNQLLNDSIPAIDPVKLSSAGLLESLKKSLPQPAAKITNAASWTANLVDHKKQCKIKLRMWRVFQAEVLVPYHLQGSFGFTLCPLVGLDQATIDADREAYLNMAAQDLFALRNKSPSPCSHLSRIVPVLAGLPTFSHGHCDPRAPPRRQVLHFFLSSLRENETESILELSPGEIILGLATSDRSLKIKKVLHTAYRRLTEMRRGEEEDDLPASMKLIRTLSELATIDIPELAKMGGEESTWTLSSLTPIAEEAVLACDCMASLYRYEAMRQVFCYVSKGWIKVDNPLSLTSDTYVNNILLEWYTSQFQVCRAEVNSWLIKSEDRFECGKCHSSAPTQWWSQIPDPTLRLNNARTCQVARSIAISQNKQAPKLLKCISETLKSVRRNLVERTTSTLSDKIHSALGDETPREENSSLDLLMDYQESSFALHLSCAKLTIEHASQIAAGAELDQFRRDFIAPVLDYIKNEELAGTYGLTGGGVSFKDFEFRSLLNWSLLWVDLLHVFIQQAISVACNREIVGQEILPLTRPMIVDFLDSAQHISRFGRKIAEAVSTTKMRADPNYSRASRNAHALVASSDSLVYCLIEIDNLLLARDIEHVRAPDEVDSYEVTGVLSPLEYIVKQEDQINVTKYVHWAEQTVKALVASFSLPPTGNSHAVIVATPAVPAAHEVTRLTKSRLVVALALLNAVLSTRSDGTGREAFRHSAVKIVESAGRLYSIAPKARVLGLRCLMLVLISAGIEAWRQAYPLLQQHFSWAAFVPVDTGAVNTGTVKPPREDGADLRTLQQIYRSLYIAMSEGKSIVRPTFTTLLGDWPESMVTKNIVFAMASTEWLWNVEFSAWRAINDGLTTYVADIDRRVVANDQTKKTVPPPIAEAVNDFARVASPWKTLEEALSGALQAEGIEVKKSIYESSMPLPPNTHLINPLTLSDPQLEVGFLEDILAAGCWYGLVVFRLLSTLVDLREETTTLLPSSDIFDRLTGLYKRVSQVRSIRFKGGPHEEGRLVNLLQIERRTPAIDHMEITRQQLLVALLRCLRLEPSAMKDTFHRTCRHQRIPELLESLLMNIDHLTAVARRVTIAHDPLASTTQDVLVGMAMSATMAIETLGLYLSAIGREDHLGVTQAVIASVSADHRSFLQRTLYESLQVLKELLKSQKIQTDSASQVVESCRQTLERLTTLLFT